MGWRGGNHPRQRFFAMHHDRLSQHHPPVNTPHIADADKRPVNLADEHTDLVHVGGQHDPATWFVLGCAPLERDQIA